MQFTILLTLILFLISSCGTYKSNPNIVPVDSSPRGLIVKNQKGKIIGRTPFFARIDKGKEHEFYFETYAKFQTTAHIKSLHYKCQIDWAQSIIPDSIFSLLGPVGWIITASSLGADYYSGGLWKCEKPIYFSDINFESAKRPVRKILVLPAFVKSEGLSLRIRKHWYQKLFVIEGKNGKHRDKIIELLKSFEEMNFKGITHLNTANFKNINKKALSQLAHKNKATHALSFKIKRRAGELEVTPILHDLFRVRDVVNSYTKKFRIPLNESEKTSRLETLLGAINLLPNAFSISYALKPKIKINSNDFQKNENEELSTKNHPEALPRIFTLFGFENVQHPSLFNTWDYSFQTFPTFSGSSWMSEFDGFSAQVINYNTAYNASITGHTSFGALSLEVGYGLGYFNYQDSRGKEEKKLKGLLRLNLNHVFFVSPQYYLKFGMNSYNLNKFVGRSGAYELKNWNQFFLGAGYYFPNFKTMLRQLIGL